MNLFKSFIIWVNFFLSILNNLFPSIINGLIFFPQLSHDICEIDDCLRLLWFELKRHFTQIKSFLKFIYLNVHNSKICMGINICVKGIQLSRKYDLVFLLINLRIFMGREFKNFLIKCNGFFKIFFLSFKIS